MTKPVKQWIACLLTLLFIATLKTSLLAVTCQSLQERSNERITSTQGSLYLEEGFAYFETVDGFTLQLIEGVSGRVHLIKGVRNNVSCINDSSVISFFNHSQVLRQFRVEKNGEIILKTYLIETENRNGESLFLSVSNYSATLFAVSTGEKGTVRVVESVDFKSNYSIASINAVAIKLPYDVPEGAETLEFTKKENHNDAYIDAPRDVVIKFETNALNDYNLTIPMFQSSGELSKLFAIFIQ